MLCARASPGERTRILYHSKRAVSIGGDDVIPPRGCRASEETTRGTRIVHGVENVQPGHTCRT